MTYPNKVSIIIPYRIKRPEQFDHLKEAIDSALNQKQLSSDVEIASSGLIKNFLDIEIIVVNDNTDLSEKKLRNCNIKYIAGYVLNSKITHLDTAIRGIKGVAAARNLGISHATGKYILCLDHDDKLDPFAVGKMIKELDSGEYDIVGSWYNRFWDHTSKAKLNTIDAITPHNIAKFLLSPHLTVTSMFRKEHWENCIKQTGYGFDENFVESLEDAEFWVRMIRVNNITSFDKCRIKIIKEPLLWYRRYKDESSRHYDETNRNFLAEKITRNNLEIYKKYIVDILGLVKESMYNYGKTAKRNRRLKVINKISIALNLILMATLIINLL